MDIISQTYRIKRPCADCPFRSDGNGIDLMPGRLSQIAHDITQGDGKTFYCHKTLSGERFEELEEEDVGYEPGRKEAACAGALIFQFKHGRLPIEARFGVMQKAIDLKAIEAQFGDVVEPEDVL